MEIKRFFPTSVGYIQNEASTASVLNIIQPILETVDSNKDLDYINSYNYPELNKKLTNNFRTKNFKEYINEFIEKLGFKIPSKIKYDFWGIWFKENLNFQPTTNYPNHIITGIAFLNNFNNPFSPLVIEDPRDIRYYNSITPEVKDGVQKSTIDNTKEIIFYPKRGDIFIWESWLKHRIEYSTTNNQIMLMFNAYKG